MQNEAELTQENKQSSGQIVLKVPNAFLERFDRTCEQLGYTRTEAIRESMRRFEQEGEQKLMQRPETAAENMRQMMTEIFRPIFEMAEKEKEAQNLAKPKELTVVSQNQPTKQRAAVKGRR